MEWAQIFTNHTSDKGLISGIYKELSELNSKKHTIQPEHEQKINRDISLKKDIHMDPELQFYDFTMLQSDMHTAKTLPKILTFDPG